MPYTNAAALNEGFYLGIAHARAADALNAIKAASFAHLVNWSGNRDASLLAAEMELQRIVDFRWMDGPADSRTQVEQVAAKLSLVHVRIIDAFSGMTPNADIRAINRAVVAARRAIESQEVV